MGIESYTGVEGLTITMDSKVDLFEIIDLIHTMTMDCFGDDSKEAIFMSKVLSEAYQELSD